MAAGSTSPSTARARDRKLLLWLGGAVLLIVALVSAVAPTEANNDPRPSSYNAGPAGAKAAFLTLQALGWTVGRWEKPLDELASVDAAHTTVILAEPAYTALNKDKLAAAIRTFLLRGGHVITTGADGALLLPGGSTRSSNHFSGLCLTQPAGPGALARAGSVEMGAPVFWTGPPAVAFAEQRCGSEPVVVRVPVGGGQAIWWSSPDALTNAELHNPADLQLLIASAGPGRRVLFDESLLQPVSTPWSVTRGLPLWWLLAQTVVVFLVMIFSFSRRRGPVRLPEGLPRSSPLEFAASMGHLYEKAGATEAATGAARRRLQRVLERDAGLSAAVVQADAAVIGKALTIRFGGDWSGLEADLKEAEAAVGEELRVRGALKLVQALGADAERVRTAARPVAKQTIWAEGGREAMRTAGENATPEMSNKPYE